MCYFHLPSFLKKKNYHCALVNGQLLKVGKKILRKLKSNFLKKKFLQFSDSFFHSKKKFTKNCTFFSDFSPLNLLNIIFIPLNHFCLQVLFFCWGLLFYVLRLSKYTFLSFLGVINEHFHEKNISLPHYF